MHPQPILDKMEIIHQPALTACARTPAAAGMRSFGEIEVRLATALTGEGQ